jgi:hypothetical protein
VSRALRQQARRAPHHVHAKRRVGRGHVQLSGAAAVPHAPAEEWVAGERERGQSPVVPAGRALSVWSAEAGRRGGGQRERVCWGEPGDVGVLEGLAAVGFRTDDSVGALGV